MMEISPTAVRIATEASLSLSPQDRGIKAHVQLKVAEAVWEVADVVIV